MLAVALDIKKKLNEISVCVNDLIPVTLQN